MSIRLTVLSLGLVLILGNTNQVEAISTEALQQGIPTLAPMLESVTPAVVSIRVRKTLPTAGNFFSDGNELPPQLRRYFGTPFNNGEQPFVRGSGSGVIVDADSGLIVTNHHVVEGASEVTVQLSDNRTFEAELIGSDAGTDVALLRISAENLAAIKFADIDSVAIGDYVVAIGNPFGIGQTVTAGIVSALGRAGLNNDRYEDFIQTDAAINVGNSGGALVDMEGRLIGVNTAIISGNGGSNGIGFAVPVDMVARVIEHLERDGEVRRGMLGVTISDVTSPIAEALALQVDSGALVTNVLTGSAAEAAGLAVSDVIVGIDGEVVNSGRELRNAVGLMQQGQEISLLLYRGGEPMTLQAIIGGNEAALVNSRDLQLNNELQGAQLSNGVDGIEVTDVRRQSLAWTAGLRAGDVIIEVNRQPVDDLAAFNSAIQSRDQFTALTINRQGRLMLLFLP